MIFKESSMVQHRKDVEEVIIHKFKLRRKISLPWHSFTYHKLGINLRLKCRDCRESKSCKMSKLFITEKTLTSVFSHLENTFTQIKMSTFDQLFARICNIFPTLELIWDWNAEVAQSIRPREHNLQVVNAKRDGRNDA